MTCPFEFTVIWGIKVPEPKVPGFEFTLFKVKVTSEEDVVETFKSPLTVKYLVWFPNTLKIWPFAPDSKTFNEILEVPWM